MTAERCPKPCCVYPTCQVCGSFGAMEIKVTWGHRKATATICEEHAYAIFDKALTSFSVYDDDAAVEQLQRKGAM